ncbi:hypothetical protein B0I35DRAFT_124609 [Stachybotrys elegans]|uniref:DUF1279 domain-containing protein n=1 Tax=Stachybotrys elegans TaxID=80388 RepID=A0A8K0T162_9HYPO|nr:hypothetical protein B0I35DRAFT_124609 [Stachybotrys elegans]
MMRPAVRGASLPLGRSVQATVGRSIWSRPATASTKSSTAVNFWWRSQSSFSSEFLRSLRAGSRRAFHETAWKRASEEAASKKSQGLGARLKRLTKEYGWAAVGVYFGLSALDLPFCYLFVKTVGAEAIGRVEHYIVSSITSVIPESVRHATSNFFSTIWNAVRAREKQEIGNDNATGTVEMATWSVEEAQKHNDEGPSLATQLALAYAIHKSLIFFRVPLAAAVTPKVVKKLRSWGWNIGKKAPPTA